MNKKTRAQLIRKGNQAFNDGQLDLARRIFIQTNYRDGLVRLGDYLYYQKKKPLLALTYYRKAGDQKKINEIFARMVWALKRWIRPEEEVRPKVEIPQVPRDQDPLYQKALEILAREGQSP